VSGVRFLARNFRETVLRAKPLAGMDRIVLAGPVSQVQVLAKEFLSDPQGRYLPVALIDPERTSAAETFRVHDIPVYPIAGIPFQSKLLRGLKAVVICWPGAARSRVNHLVKTLEPLQVPYKIVPTMEDILAEKVSISELREVEIEDLLERPPVQTDLEAIGDYIAGQVVLVTGGGGSIGSELCRQIAAFRPGALVVVERAENSLMDLKLELRQRFPDLALHSVISSINDGPGLTRLMCALKPRAVFHAAAYKHVPLMEAAPVESAYNNIIGTYNAARAAIVAGVRRFVMVSTDKAVNPTNVMGVTKRIAEMVVQSFNGGASTRFMTVRFGNVLGSAGSVIPIFKRQIAAGGPVTVTHPDMQRFFMTIPESVQLILQAASMGAGGEVFVLDMGQPMKILHLAENLIALSGKRPYEDIGIVFTHVRPGEKLFEELFDSCENCTPTAHPRILKAQCPHIDTPEMERHVAEIRALIQSRDEPGLRAKFQSLVPGYQMADTAQPAAEGAELSGEEAEVPAAACAAGHITARN
jgi:FlaA1/EpsC-like NDP-sugar epimerase